MRKAVRNKREISRRYFVFFVSLFIMSFGVSLVTGSLTGTSPISGIPYVWSLNTALSMGTYIIILNALLIVAQILMLGRQGVRQYKVELLMQIPVSLLFGVILVLIAIGCSWIFAGRIDGVREGTVIVAVFTGPLVRLIRPHLGFIDCRKPAPAAV